MFRLLVTTLATVLTASSFSTLADAATILIMRPGDQAFQATAQAATRELAQRHTIKEFIYTAVTAEALFADAVRTHHPRLLILLDSRAVAFAQRYLASDEPEAQDLQAVAAMASNLKRELAGERRISGIAWEAPPFVMISRLKSSSSRPLRTLLTIYRGSESQGLVDDAARQLQIAGVELIALDVEVAVGSTGDYAKFVADNIADQYVDSPVDAVWVMPDRALNAPALLDKVWQARSRELEAPFLCGKNAPTTPAVDFCAVNATPDLADLGDQIAQQAFSILDERARPGEIGVEYMVSYTTIVHSKVIQ